MPEKETPRQAAGQNRGKNERLINNTTPEARLQAALEYCEAGFSVIPIRPDNKKPFVAWAKYQKEKADQRQIIRWLNKFPAANIGIVTGDISNLTVIDLDSPAAVATFNALGELPPTPAARTPRGGMHVYFAQTEGMRTVANVLTKTDIRDKGGYVIAPPSANGKGSSYTWEPGRSLLEVTPAEMSETVVNVFKKAFNRGGADTTTVHTSPQVSTNVHNFLSEGNRDEQLFHLANHLVKSGMPLSTIQNYLYFFAENCNPPFPANEVKAKIQSALQRSENQERNLMQEVREWVLSTSGYFLSTELYNCLHLSTRQDKKNVSTYLTRLADEGILERTGSKNGQYRRIENDVEVMDFEHASTEKADLWLPLSLNKLVNIMPGNIIVVAGAPNSGKTGLLLNLIKGNQRTFQTHYFNSEMGPGELRTRLEKFGDPLSTWKFKAYERSSNFADVLKAGPENLNIIDFLEIHENFYEIGGRLKEIHDRLKGAVAIIAIQKNRGASLGLGGGRGEEKPRLYLSMDNGLLRIIKGKNWAQEGKNPNGLEIKFKLVNGCTFLKVGDWRRPEPDQGAK